MNCLEACYFSLFGVFLTTFCRYLATAHSSHKIKGNAGLNGNPLAPNQPIKKVKLTSENPKEAPSLVGIMPEEALTRTWIESIAWERAKEETERRKHFQYPLRNYKETLLMKRRFKESEEDEKSPANFQSKSARNGDKKHRRYRESVKRSFEQRDKYAFEKETEATSQEKEVDLEEELFWSRSITLEKIRNKSFVPFNCEKIEDWPRVPGKKNSDDFQYGRGDDEYQPEKPKRAKALEKRKEPLFLECQRAPNECFSENELGGKPKNFQINSPFGKNFKQMSQQSNFNFSQDTQNCCENTPKKKKRKNNPNSCFTWEIRDI